MEEEEKGGGGEEEKLKGSLTQMSAFSLMGLLEYKSIISGERYIGVVLRLI